MATSAILRTTSTTVTSDLADCRCRRRRHHAASTGRWIRLASLCTLGFAVPGWLSAIAGAAWSPVVRLSPPRELAESPELGLGPHGEAVAVWGTSVGPPAYGQVFVSEQLRRGRGWSRPDRLSGERIFAGWPGIAVDRSGEAVVVWQSGGVSSGSSGPPPTIDASVERHAGARWSRPVRLSASTNNAAEPVVGVDSRGTAVALWYTSRRHVHKIQAANFDPQRDRWSSPVTLYRSRQLLVDPQLALSRRGEAVAIWERWVSGSPLSRKGMRFKIESAVRPAGRRKWLMPVELGTEIEPAGQTSGNPESPGPHVAADDSGDAVAVWQMGTPRHVIAGRAIWNAKRKSWRGPKPVTQHYALMPQVAVDFRGDATVVWRGAKGKMEAIAGSATSGAWTSTVTLSRQMALFPTVAMDRFGDALASWGGARVQASFHRESSHKWHATANVGPPGGAANVEVAFNQKGVAIAVWQQTIRHPRGSVIETASYRR